MIILKYLKIYKSWIDAVCEENLYFKVDRFYKSCDIKYSNFAHIRIVPITAGINLQY